jgi:hypothetical protein
MPPLLADGTTLSLFNSEANQAAYPQSKTQKPGLGFPVLRLVVLIEDEPIARWHPGDGSQRTVDLLAGL